MTLALGPPECKSEEMVVPGRRQQPLASGRQLTGTLVATGPHSAHPWEDSRHRIPKLLLAWGPCGLIPHVSWPDPCDAGSWKPRALPHKATA